MCLFVNCNKEGKEGDFFCVEHRGEMKKSGVIVICDRCGRVIRVGKGKEREVKHEVCSECSKFYK